MQEKILAKARNVGADAVLFESLEKRISGSNTNIHEDQHGAFVISSNTEDKLIKAKLLKFRS